MFNKHFMRHRKKQLHVNGFLPSKYEKNGCPKKSFHKTFEHYLLFFYRSLFKRKYIFWKLDIDLSPLKTMFTLCLSMSMSIYLCSTLLINTCCDRLDQFV